MRRRTFIEIVGGAAVTWPLAARAQPSGKVYRIGFPRRDLASRIRTLRRPTASGPSPTRIRGRQAHCNRVSVGRGQIRPPSELAAELVKLNVDVIVTHSTPGSRAAKQATSTVPIVMAAVGDPVDTGFVASLALGREKPLLQFAIRLWGAHNIYLEISRAAVRSGFAAPSLLRSWLPASTAPILKRPTQQFSIILVVSNAY